VPTLMALFYPKAPRETEPSSERRVREFLGQLGPDWRVFCSVAWQSVRHGRQGDGEADFVLVHPRDGVVVLEVKGGAIDVVDGGWRTTSRQGKTSAIKDPFRQASDSKYALLTFLQGLPEFRPIPRICHAAVFPDATVHDAIGTYPRALVIDATDLIDAPRAVERVVTHWEQKNGSDLDGSAVEAITRLLAPTLAIRKRMVSEVAAAEKEIVHLTAKQVEVLQTLRSVRRCIVRGGAGTGKTLLAVEKARQLASQGARVLLTTFNAPLAEYINSLCTDVASLTVTTFHSLVGTKAAELGARVPNESFSWWEVESSKTLARYVELRGTQFDALVLDEAQDFSDAWFTALRLLLDAAVDAPIYVFLDNHQQLYHRNFTSPAWPIAELDRNCRNTRHIASTVARIYADPEPTEGASGPAPIFIESARPADGPPHVQGVVDRLLREEGFLPSQIAVLCEQRADVERLRTLIAGESPFVPMGAKGVVAETIHRFRGLEAEVLVLLLSGTTLDALLYVGMSRARSLLVVIAPAQLRSRVLSSKPSVVVHGLSK
jgi:hypothetical protein